ncbi:MAG: DMT family transporter [Clostridiales bacterium]|nr:DMT family transporter [Clostridiales bacterium]
MFVAYMLISVSAVLFSCQFLFQKKYNDTEGVGVYAAFLFSFLTAIVRIILVLAIYGFEHEFTMYSSLLALIASAGLVLNAYFSAKAFENANMSLYSMFMMLGGMILPFIFGIICFDESMTVTKLLCCVFIFVALIINVDMKDKGTRSAVKYYIGVFITNGMAGVIAKFNQSSANGIKSSSYLMLTGIWTAAISVIFVIIIAYKQKKVFVKPGSALISSAMFGLMTSLGNLFVLIALETLPASVQYPMITGGTIVVSTLISYFRKEKLTKRSWIAVAVSLAASIIMAF